MIFKTAYIFYVHLIIFIDIKISAIRFYVCENDNQTTIDSYNCSEQY